MPAVQALPASALCQRCDPAQFDFRTTDDLESLDELIGQARAIEALHFGIGIRSDGYNLFVLGPPGLGKYTMVRQYLEQRAENDKVPSDWCYVNNFDKSHKPIVLQLPAGKGREFSQDMARLIEDLQAAIPLAFETEEYHNRVKEVEENFKRRREEAIGEIAGEAEANNIALIRTSEGFAFVAKKDGHVIEPEAFDALPEKEKRRIESTIQKLRDRLSNLFHLFSQWQRETREKVRAINRDVGMFAVGHLIHDLKTKYQGMDGVEDYLETVQQDVIEHLGDFIDEEETVGRQLRRGDDQEATLRRYQVNLLVDNGGHAGAPVIYEDSPMHQNLVGRVEHLSRMGALVTDFLLIKPGSLHRANGGYLILDARKLLMQPYAWEGLKRALYSREIRIESLGQIYSLVSTVSLEPEPIPLDLKVVLLGDRLLYYLLGAYDPDFTELFKVAADFEESMPRSDENTQLYARMIATIIHKEKLLPFDRDAVARIIEHGARKVGDALKLTTHMLSMANLLREADFWARSLNRDLVKRDEVQHAIDKQIHRADRLQTHMQEEIRRGTVLIDTDGSAVGQVNGLFVIDLGEHSFAHPGRITATTRLGEGDIIDIEREVELGGAIHSKGVMILSSFIGARYGQQRPLSLTASLVFEQTYGPVEGDSASVGECCALLSSLGKVPIRQSLAVTGSVNQHGQVQAIGAVNDKIEGFFDVCRQAGFNGEQGVIIPQSNVEHLMLRQDVVRAVEEGRFSIYAVSTLDEALELLTGMEPGQRDPDGRYPKGSINQRIEDRIAEMAETRQAFAHGPDREEEEEREKSKEKNKG